MLFASYALFFSILLFVTLYVAAKWCFKKSWLNNILLVGGNVLILTQIVSWKSLFLLSLLSLLAYGVGLLLRKRKSGWVLGLALSLLILLFAVRNYPLPRCMTAISLLNEYDFKGKGGEAGEAAPSELLMELVTKLLNC